MSPTDLPQVPSEHAGTIIADNWPGTSETNTVATSIDLFRRAAESVGTGETAETMTALIEASASGHTPEELVSDFTAEQRKAFDAALRQLNQGHTASAMAQDILNTKVALNGTVVEFEAAMEQLIAAAAAAPQTPKTQEEFQRRYQELLNAAKEQASQLGSNHKATQDALATGVEQGVVPDIPSTMAPTSAEYPTVPGMPDGALGGLLQSVAGQMMKPQNLGFPNLNQLGQSMAPMAQAAQSALGQLMSSIPGAGAGGGLPVTDDALSLLTSASGIGDQDATLSDPATGAGAGASPMGPAAGGPSSGRTAADTPRTTLAAEAPDTARAPLPGAAPLASTPLPGVDATVPAAPAVTAAPLPQVPVTTLSAGDAAVGPETLSAARTHTSGGDAAAGSATLTATAAGPAAGAAAASPMAMPPMMPPMMGGIGNSQVHNGSGHSADRNGHGGRDGRDGESGGDPSTPRFEAFIAPVPVELRDAGDALKGMQHATEMEMVAASILAGLVRAHDREGVGTHIAVGVSATSAVFVTSDGLGFLPPGVRAAKHLTPLITLVGDDFVERWLGCDQPWRPLLDAVAVGVAGPFEAIVTTDADAATVGVLALTPEQLDAVNIAAGSAAREEFDAVDEDDIEGALTYLKSVWGAPQGTVPELESLAWWSRWVGHDVAADHPRRWVHYLIAAADADIAIGDVGDARYALRCALRVPEPKES